jgi:hypothetical protein
LRQANLDEDHKHGSFPAAGTDSGVLILKPKIFVPFRTLFFLHIRHVLWLSLDRFLAADEKNPLDFN